MSTKAAIKVDDQFCYAQFNGYPDFTYWMLMKFYRDHKRAKWLAKLNSIEFVSSPWAVKKVDLGLPKTRGSSLEDIDKLIHVNYFYEFVNDYWHVWKKKAILQNKEYVGDEIVPYEVLFETIEQNLIVEVTLAEKSESEILEIAREIVLNGNGFTDDKNVVKKVKEICEEYGLLCFNS